MWRSSVAGRGRSGASWAARCGAVGAVAGREGRSDEICRKDTASWGVVMRHPRDGDSVCSYTPGRKAGAAPATAAPPRAARWRRRCAMLRGGRTLLAARTPHAHASRRRERRGTAPQSQAAPQAARAASTSAHSPCPATSRRHGRRPHPPLAPARRHSPRVAGRRRPTREQGCAIHTHGWLASA